jgi:hypothetical protein
VVRVPETKWAAPATGQSEAQGVDIR